MRKSISLIAVVLMLMTMGYASFAFGAISAEEANKLGGTVLTPIGAERAGNKDGTIPAWTGVQIPIPKGFKAGSGTRPDPFADEKPLFSINGKNMAQYADKLAEGVKSLMKRYPEYRIDIYQTHRTLVFPQRYYDNTKRNATACQIAKEGRAVIGKDCYGGIPFPMPKTGDELMWNHAVKFRAPQSLKAGYENYNISSSGKVSLSAAAIFYIDMLWNAPEKIGDYRYGVGRYDYTGPARRSGEKLLFAYPKDWAANGSVIWQYLPGQRRMRLAPDICCDTPASGTAGASTYDDTGVFNGDPERYNWKLVGKKELYIPYNTYKFTYYQGDANKVVLARYINPDMVRWELHRVWVVEGTLKPKKRHIYGRRVLYFDEDCMSASMSDNYDKTGNLYRMSVVYPTYSYDVQALYNDLLAYYDMISNSYAVNVWPRGNIGVRYTNFLPDSFYSPDSIAGEGLR